MPIKTENSENLAKRQGKVAELDQFHPSYPQDLAIRLTHDLFNEGKY